MNLQQARAEFLKPVIFAKDKQEKAAALLALEITVFTNPQTGKTRCYSKSTIFRWLRELPNELIEQLKQSISCENVDVLRTDRRAQVMPWMWNLVFPALAHPKGSLARKEILKQLVGKSITHPRTKKVSILTMNRLNHLVRFYEEQLDDSDFS